MKIQRLICGILGISLLCLWSACVKEGLALRLHNSTERPITVAVYSRHLGLMKTSQHLYLIESQKAADIEWENLIGYIRITDGATIWDYQVSADSIYDLNEAYYTNRNSSEFGADRYFASFSKTGAIGMRDSAKESSIFLLQSAAPLPEGRSLPVSCWPYEATEYLNSEPGSVPECIIVGTLSYPFVLGLSCPTTLLQAIGFEFGSLFRAWPSLKPEKWHEQGDIFWSTTYGTCKWVWLNLGGERARYPLGEGLPPFPPKDAAPDKADVQESTVVEDPEKKQE